MNSFKKAILRLCGYVVEQKLPDPTEQTKGVLFGLDPPKDCYFAVSYYKLGDSWNVYIMSKDEKIAEWGIAYMGYGDYKDNESAIKAAALGALVKYKAKQSIADLEGNYPPKRTA